MNLMIRKVKNDRIFTWQIMVAFFLAAIIFLLPNKPLQAASVSGRILLQVESHGEAWYVNPVDGKRYYMGRPDDAFALMRSFGLGARDADIGSYQISQAPSRLSGRILLQVQDKGQAFYIYPLDLKLYYLGRPSDAFSVMRALGLGISNSDLAKIPIGSSSKTPTASTDLNSNLTPVPSLPTSPSSPSISGQAYDKVFEFKYKNTNRTLTQTLYKSFYDAYAASPKTYSYPSGSDVVAARNSFYGIFLNLKSGDTSLDEIIYKLKATANSQSWSDDELLEFAMTLVQFIPYDDVKVSGSLSNINPYYPYETLYLNRGVCSDKTFLAVLMIRKLGYGAAIFDFPDSNHSAAAVSCPLEYSISNSGYCYIETTNYFPLGVVPKTLNAGVATENENDFENLFNASRLGKLEIYQKTTGKSYYLISQTVSRANEITRLSSEIKTESAAISETENYLKSKEAEIALLKQEMDALLAAGQIAKYNSMIPEYNALVNEYNADLNDYKLEVSAFNAKIDLFNQYSRDFYQK